jgi:CheY-like chemotaxis protein
MNYIESPPAAKSCGRSLLLCDDAKIIEQITGSMEELAISTELCVTLPLALRLLNRRKFEAVVVDFQLVEQAKAAMERVRLSPSNRTAVTFAIINRDSEATVAFSSGANFVLERPLSISTISRTLKAAYGLIVRERRRYFRCPTNVFATFQQPSMPAVQCQVVNISEGGLAISTSVPLKPGTRIKVEFRLQDQPTDFAVESEVCWYDEQGHAGLQFRPLSTCQQSELQEWLAKRLEDSLPEAVVQKFGSGNGSDVVECDPRA